MAMWAMMIFGEPADAAGQAIVRRARGLWEQRLMMSGVDGEDAEQVIQFLGQESERRWMRQTELVAGFIWLRRFYQGLGM